MENKSNIVHHSFAEYTPVSPAESVDRKGWLSYGQDNLFPQYLDELAKSSPVHGALNHSITQIIKGKGLNAGTYTQAIVDIGLEKAHGGAAADKKKYGGYYIEIIYDSNEADRRIARINHLPFDECRIAVSGEQEVEVGIFHSTDWKQAQGRKKKYHPTFIPKFNWLTRSTEARQVYWCFNYAGSQVYPKPDYWPAVNYIELDRQIGIYHVNNIMNGLFPSFIINFFYGQASPEDKMKLQTEWNERMAGAKNAGKALFFFNERDTTKPDIQSFPLSDADKQYEFLSKEATAKIMIGHRVTTPLLFGVRDQTGFGSNKDEMATGLAIFNRQVIEPEQREIAEGYEYVLSNQYNGIQIEIVPNTPLELPQAAAPQVPATQQPQQLSAQKTALDEFIELGEDAPEGYFILDVSIPGNDDDKENEMLASHKFTSTGTARPNASSEQDETIGGALFITRYRYRGELKPNTREFCRKMLSAGKLYRKEDIVQMENKPVNPGWGPEGADTYPIWLYKGGGDCHHFWQKEVYMSIEGAGIDVNNPNARQMAVARAEKLGYKVRNEALVAKLPVDMPFNGFLPTNPRFN